MLHTVNFTKRICAIFIQSLKFTKFSIDFASSISVGGKHWQSVVDWARRTEKLEEFCTPWRGLETMDGRRSSSSWNHQYTVRWVRSFTSYCVIIESWYLLSRHFDFVKFQFEKRSGNFLAHILATLDTFRV